MYINNELKKEQCGAKYMNKYLKENERIDDLQLNGLKLIQNPDYFCFGVDAVLLSDFAAKAIKKGSRVMDFCCGSGIIPVLLSAKCDAKNLFGLELFECMADIAKRNVKLNGLDEKVEIICGDVKKEPFLFKKCSFDYITCNPPYKEAGTGIKNSDSVITAARHEIFLSLEEVLCSAAALLVPGGKIALVHRPERLADIIRLMYQNKIEPKRLRFVHPYPQKTATMILIEGTKHGGRKLFLEPPLYIYDENRNYTDEINRIYGRI